MSGKSERMIPKELKTLHKLFEEVGYRWDVSRIFEDFLTMTLAYFSRGNALRNDRDESLKRYNDKEKAVFSKMFYELLNIYQNQITTDTDWYDPLGNYYEYQASSSKQSWFGQFFTPETVVNMMVQIQDKMINAGKTINDPTCGSGRFLIAFHAHNPGNYTFGEDIDPICVKMTAINMMMHGCEGEVICHDSLKVDDFRFGYWINSDIRNIGLPSIEPITKEQSLIIGRFNPIRKAQKMEEAPVIIPEITFTENKKQQFVMF